MNIVRKNLEHILPTGFSCAETPYWVAEESAVYFVDTENPRIARYTVDSGTLRVFHLPYNFQCIAKCTDGNWIGTVSKGVVLWSQEKGECRYLGNPEKGRGSCFLNDGTVDRKGRFFFGSYDLANLKGGDGSIFMVDHDLSIRRIATGFSVCNGMVFSPDNSRFYMSEQFGGRILGFDFDEERCELSSMETVYSIPEEEGLPDGLIMDSEGMLWVAHWWGWRISRITPAGELLAVIPMPVASPTSMAFSGKNQDQLIITSARKAVSDEDLEQGPLAGDIFSIELNISGINETRFINNRNGGIQ